MSKTPELPFSNLGKALKQLREKRQESLAEVAGAVEIEIDNLTQMETGADRPGEDILLLLISHFSVKEDEATKLWELAGYDQNQLPASNMANDANGDVNQTVMVLPMDARVIYSDMVHVMVNNYGVVMNFLQSNGQNGQPIPAARVGMSREHAKSVLEVLQRTLAQSEQKSLPANSQDKSQSTSQEKPSK